MKYKEAIKQSMQQAMEKPNNILIGQGITDFKGIWDTTTDLHKQYPDRVIETPIAEDSTAGICIGIALKGMYPINIHIRSDFSLLMFNQLINHAAKYKYMFGGLFELPMLFRLVIGRSWGQGAQHSQSLQSLLAHIPGLVVLMPSTPKAILKTYEYAINNYKGPVVSFEHRLMYDLSIEEDSNYELKDPFSSRLISEGKDITIVASSIMVLEALRAQNFLKKNHISCDIIDLHSISNPNKELIINSIKKTGRLVVLDSSWVPYGVSSEISRIILESDPSLLQKPAKFIGMQNASCPTAKPLEDLFYPDLHDIIFNIAELLEGDSKNIQLPQKGSIVDHYKHYKGPF